MDKTYRTEMFRTFLIEALPEPLQRSSSHLQFFDNYISNTRLRIRSIRDPETKEWTRILQQRFAPNPSERSAWKIAEMYLDDAEYAQLAIFEGTEIRKNRYFHEFDARMFAFDVYLGKLWGLNRARIEFTNADDVSSFRPPPFTVYEITNDAFFDDSNLVNQTLDAVRLEIEKLGSPIVSNAAPDQ